MSRFNRVVDFSVTPSGSETPAAAKPAHKAVAPVVTKPVERPAPAFGKYKDAVPVNVKRDAVETAVVVKVAPAATPAAKPAQARTAVGYSMNAMDAKTAGSGKLVITCNGQKLVKGKLVACGCKGLPESMVAPQIEDLRRLHHGDPRPEHVLAEVRCRASSKLDARGLRYRGFVGVMVRADEMAKEYDRSLMDGPLGRLMAKVQAAATPAAPAARKKTA